MHDLHSNVLTQMKGVLDGAGADRAKLEATLRLLAKWRSVLIQSTVLQACGTVVQAGPFKGMKFVSQSAEGCHVPKLLGCYEQELHASVEAAITRGYAHVLNIGMAEGYYATGLALRMPETTVHAFDLNEKAHPVARQVAELNGVSARVRVGGLFRGEDFADYPAGDTLVVCDIEGAERDLLDPVAFPALIGHDLIVEVHECFRPGLLALLEERFAGTHAIETIWPTLNAIALPALFQNLGHLDQLLAVWEWRSGPTPWMVMRRR